MICFFSFHLFYPLYYFKHQLLFAYQLIIVQNKLKIIYIGTLKCIDISGVNFFCFVAHLIFIRQVQPVLFELTNY